jgi:hypothetical protein
MIANRRLARVISDVEFFEFGGNSKSWFASSKLCSDCGVKNETVTLVREHGRAYRAARLTTAISTRQ